MLASDSDTASDWDSDSGGSEDCGPLKQAWGTRDLKSKQLPSYDFVSNVPQDGEEYLMAVMNERRKTPTCVAADKKKIDEIKKRKSKSPSKPDSVLNEEASKSSAEPAEVEGVTSDLDKLELGSDKQKDDAKVSVAEEFEQLARFLPTPKWRANQLAQFTYIRMKMDLARDMMLQGRYYVVPTFTKFEKDRLYWLRYCFGTVDAATMIDIKRAKKLRAKEQYEEAKRLKSLQKAGDSGEESQDSDVEFVSREEVANLESAADKSQDDLMKISGGSLDELVVVPQPGRNEDSQILKTTEVPSVQTVEGSTDGQVHSTTISLSENSKTEASPSSDPPMSTDVTKSEATAPENTKESESVMEETATSTSEQIQGSELAQKDQVMPSAHETDGTIPENIGSKGGEAVASEHSKTLPEPPEKEVVDPVAEERKLNGQLPTTNLLLSMPQRLVEYLLSIQLEWLREFGLINRKQGNWLYATMSCLQVPFEPDVICDLRQIAIQCIQIRDLAKQLMLDAEKNSEEPNSSSSAIILINHNDNFGLIDVVSSCNLFISLVVDYFVQKDLNKHLSYDGKDEF